MRKKFFLVILATAFGFSVSGTQAATRATAPIETTTYEDPSSEKRCLEAFVDSNFEYAHRLCLSLAQLGMKDAQLVTGLMYAFGEGTEKNPEKAKLWLKEALRNGSQEAVEVLKEIDAQK